MKFIGIITLILVILLIRKFIIVDHFKIQNHDVDNVLAENYSKPNFEPQNKFNRYLINRNNLYNNIFRGSVLNKYYDLLDLNITF